LNDPTIDPERLAALMDGRLGAAERRAILSRLASADDETLGGFAGAVAVAGEVENGTAAPAPGGVSHLPPRWTRAAWVSAAAAVVAAVGIGGYAWRTSTDAAEDPTRFVEFIQGARLESPAMHLWTTRGGTAQSSARNEALAVRIGACITDLSLATSTGDSTAREIVASIIRTLSEVDGSTSAIAKYRRVEAELRAGERPREEQLRDAARSAAVATGQPATRAGAWVQAARVAAARRDRGFFAHEASRAVLDSIATVELPEPAAEAVVRVRREASDRDPDWPALHGALTELLGALVE
jgi:hypothetical protein